MLGWANASAFGLQFAIAEAAFRGPRAWPARPVLFADLLASVAIGTLALVLVSRTSSRLVRAAMALLAATILVSQAVVYRYLHAPLDVQIAAGALFSWKDVRQVVLRSMPGLVVAIGAVAVLEYSLLVLVRRSVQARLPRPTPVLACAALAGLVSAGPRNATPEVRAAHALSAFGVKRPPVTSSKTPLPTLLVERPVPNVLFVLTESVRASDYRPTGPEATAAATFAVTKNRVDLRQMRSVSSYTAVSLSAVLTARSQEGPRAEILRAPTLFDFAHAARDARGARPTVAYYSAQSQTVFETDDVRGAADRFVTIETLYGSDVTEEEDYASHAFDKEIVDRFLADLPSMATPRIAMLHLIGTHAPYFFEPEHAPFQPWDHVVTWSRMAKLHNAYQNAIVEQDRTVARAISAFVEQ